MVIDTYFMFYKKPAQYIFSGENHLDLYKTSNKRLNRIKTYENTSIFDLNSSNFEEIKAELDSTETGIILNSGYFIFNIFEFDKIPLRENLLRDIVEWRVKKIFPEDIVHYEHNFFRVSRNKILSILFKKSLREKIEALFEDKLSSLIYMGNSTVEIINNLKNSMFSPDLFIEINRNLSIFVFMTDSIPFYIRKFRSDTPGDIVDEIGKTINFVNNNYSKTTRTCAIISNSIESQIDLIRNEMAGLNIRELSIKNSERLILPE